MTHADNGITRIRDKDNNFEYFYIDNGKKVNASDLDRIKRLRIPPAWESVWINVNPDSAIQAYGIDSKGRKQYRYHQIHVQQAEEQKFIRLYHFSQKIAAFRKKLIIDAKGKLYEKDTIIALMLLLVYDYYFRVGKEVYARENGSYGISSLRKKHVKIDNGVVHFRFKGKSNQKLDFTIRNPFYLNQIAMLLKLDGDRLFQYTTVDRFGNNKVYPVTDKDLNEYIKMHMGDDFTIKDFRTYGANYHFVRALQQVTKKNRPTSNKVIKKNIRRAVEITAKFLRHTQTISKKSYVNNYIIEVYQNDPDYFIQRLDNPPEEVLKELLHNFIKEIISQS